MASGLVDPRGIFGCANSVSARAKKNFGFEDDFGFVMTSLAGSDKRRVVTITGKRVLSRAEGDAGTLRVDARRKSELIAPVDVDALRPNDDPLDPVV